MIEETSLKDLTERISAAEAYFSREDIPQEEKNKFWDAYKKLINKLTIFSSKYYSKKLNLKFSFDPQNLDMVFEDGVRYTIDEQEAVISMTDPDIVGIHKLKNDFDGKILPTQNQIEMFV